MAQLFYKFIIKDNYKKRWPLWRNFCWFLELNI